MRNGPTCKQGRRQVKNVGWTHMASAQSASLYWGLGQSPQRGPGPEPLVKGQGQSPIGAENRAFGAKRKQQICLKTSVYINDDIDQRWRVQLTSGSCMYISLIDRPIMHCSASSCYRNPIDLAFFMPPYCSSGSSGHYSAAG